MTESSSFEHPSRVGPSDESDGHHTPGLRRREFLAVGALPLAAALGPASLVSRHACSVVT